MRRIGPGPAKYNIPSTIGAKSYDSRKRTAPSYILGQRIKTRAETITPGPCNYEYGSLTRYGKDHCSSYMGHKIKMNAVNPNPAPNAYNLPVMIGRERTNVIQKRSPEYAFGQRIPLKFNSITPGPNAYKLRSLIGPESANSNITRAPAYVIGKKIETTMKSITPGPDKYYPDLTNRFKLHTTMQPRRPQNIHSITPAPNNYNLQGYKPGRNEPAYTIRRKLPDWTQPFIIEADNL